MFVNHIHLKPAALRADGTPEAFLRLADALQLDGAVCFAPFSHQMAGPNLWLARELAAHPALVGYGTLDPTRPPRDQVAEIVDLGLRGVKLHPAAQRFHLLSDWARDAYALLSERGLVADFHTGIHQHRIADTNPLLLDEVAFHYPELRMVFEHVGGWHFYRQVLAVIGNNQGRGDHLYAGIASVLDSDKQRSWYLGPAGLDDCRWQIGPDCLIYGLDFPYNQQADVERDLDLIRQMGWPEEDVDKLLGGNLKRLLGL
jgi:hypothetical protein